MTTDKYILDGKTPILEPDLLKWGEWMQTANLTFKKDTGIVSQGNNNVGEVRVSTVFLGLDHSFNGKEPILFETMIFGGPLDQEMDRCSTWEAAEQMHGKMCERVRYVYLKLNK